jgi:hypothetical protein
LWIYQAQQVVLGINTWLVGLAAYVELGSVDAGQPERQLDRHVAAQLNLGVHRVTVDHVKNRGSVLVHRWSC